MPLCPSSRALPRSPRAVTGRSPCLPSQDPLARRHDPRSDGALRFARAAGPAHSTTAHSPSAISRHLGAVRQRKGSGLRSAGTGRLSERNFGGRGAEAGRCACEGRSPDASDAGGRNRACGRSQGWRKVPSLAPGAARTHRKVSSWIGHPGAAVRGSRWSRPLLGASAFPGRTCSSACSASKRFVVRAENPFGCWRQSPSRQSHSAFSPAWVCRPERRPSHGGVRPTLLLLPGSKRPRLRTSIRRRPPTGNPAPEPRKRTVQSSRQAHLRAQSGSQGSAARPGSCPEARALKSPQTGVFMPHNCSI